MDITEFRKQYPQYNDLSDSDLADALYTKFYSDMPRGTFEGHFRPSMVAEEQASQPLRETIAETEALSPIPTPMETPPLPKFSDKMKEASDTVMDAIAETAAESFDKKVESTIRPPGIYQGEGDFDTPAGALRQFTGNLLNEAGLGLPEYLSGAEIEKPGGTVEDIAAGAGKLAGFIIGAPGRVTKLVATGLRKAMPKLATSAAAPVLTRTAKLVAQEAPALGVGMASASLGEALKKDNLSDALNTLGKAFVSGAAMGGTFAVTRGMFPVDRIGRIATGIALLDLQRGSTPIDERKLSQKVFDYGIDTFFLWHGLGTKGLDRVENELADKGVKIDKPTAPVPKGEQSAPTQTPVVEQPIQPRPPSVEGATEAVPTGATSATDMNVTIEPGTKVYRQGNKNGKWWSFDKEYAYSFGKRGENGTTKPVHTREVPEGLRLIDEPDLKKLPTETIDQALDRLGYDGMTRLEEQMTGPSVTSVYLKSAETLRPVTPEPKAPIEGEGKESWKTHIRLSKKVQELPSSAIRILESIPTKYLGNFDKYWMGRIIRFFKGQKTELRYHPEATYIEGGKVIRGSYDPIGNRLTVAPGKTQVHLRDYVLSHELGHMVYKNLPKEMRGSLNEEIFAKQFGLYQSEVFGFDVPTDLQPREYTHLSGRVTVSHPQDPQYVSVIRNIFGEEPPEVLKDYPGLAKSEASRTSSFRTTEDVHKSETFTNPERQASENTRETVYRNVYASREPYRAEGEPPSATPRREQRATEPPITSAETKYGWDEQRQEFKMPERVPIVDLPEIIEMVRLVNRRSVPTIAKKIRNTSTQGYFNPLTGKIKLNPNVQKDPRELAETISHEVGHLWDWMSEKERDTIKKRGNILGHIGALKEYAGEYLKEHPKSTAEVITEADISMLRQEAERQVAAEAEQKTGGLPPVPTPDEILDVWRSMDVKDKALETYIKLLSDAEKVELVKAAMKKAELPEWFSFRRAAEGAVDPAKVEAILHTLLRNEILARKLYERDTIQRELQDLSTFWRPFDVNKDRKYTKYRFKPEELYADMVSVLFNDPMLLKRFAPESYKAVFAYMDARPEMKNAYDSVISRIIDPVKLMQGRDENLQRMWDMSNVASKQGAINWQRQHPISELKHWLKVTLSEKNQRWLEHVRKVKGEGKVIRPEDNPWYWLEEGAYIDGLGFTYLNHVNVEPFRLYKESGVSEADFKSYLFLRRLSEYEDQKLNPLGHTKESADKFLYEYLPQKYGEDIVAKLDAVSDAWFKVRQDIVFPIIEQSRILRPDWMELIKSRKYYVKFNAIREFKNMGLDEETVGYFYRPPEGLGKLYARVGSAKEIENPFVSTIRQDMALMRAAHRKLTADSMVRFLQENFPDEVRPAIYEQQVRRYALAPQGMQTIRFMEQGKVKAWNIPVELAQMFADNHYKADVAVRAMDLFGNFFQRVSALPKRLMVTNNPIFVLWNTLYRDPKAFYRHVEEAGIKDVTWHILKNIKPTWDHVFRGKPHELLDEMYRNFMLITKRHYGTEAVTPDLEVDRMFMSWGLKPEDFASKELSPFAKVLDALEKPLEFGEKLIKVAGYSFLKESPVKRSTKEMAHIVRTRIGTPDSRRAGLAMKFYNNLFMYSNIAKEGVRASLEAMRVSPFSFFYKTTIMDILPKALMYAASIGVFDQINPDMKRIMDGFSDYLKQNYIMIPIGLDNTGNSVGFIMPQDYTGQIIGGMFWLTATMNRNDDLLNFNKYMLNQIPYAGLNPVLQLAIDYSRYIAGVNPFDSYTGGNVIPDNTWKAGRWSFESWKAMMKHTFNTLGMSAVWQRLDNRPKVQVQSWLKDLMNVPVAGKVLERFIRVDNIGKLQEIYNELRPIEEGRYQELNDMDRVIFDALAYDDPTHKGKFNLSPERIMQLYDGLYKEGKLRRHTPDQFAERYRNAAIMASNPVWFKAWLYATNEERIKILTMYMDQKRRSE